MPFFLVQAGKCCEDKLAFGIKFLTQSRRIRRLRCASILLRYKPVRDDVNLFRVDTLMHENVANGLRRHNNATRFAVGPVFCSEKKIALDQRRNAVEVVTVMASKDKFCFRIMPNRQSSNQGLIVVMGMEDI